MASFTPEQFQELLQALRPQPTQNDPSALGPMKPFVLGTNKMTRLKRFEEWLEDANSRMQYIGTHDDAAKIILLKTWAGTELVEYMKIHAKVYFEAKPATDTDNAIAADTFNQIITKTKEEMRKSVNRTLAMHKLMETKQGDRPWMDFIKDLENKAHILSFDTIPYKHAEAVKDAAIFGMTDTALREKALAEDPSLDTLVRWGQARETGREGSNTLKQDHKINRVSNQDFLRALSDDELDDMMQTLQVMKIRKQGKYSQRSSKPPPKGDCLNCSTAHPPGRCPARGKDCFTCGGTNHFSKSPACSQSKSVRFDLRRIETDTDSSDEDTAYGATATDTIGRIQSTEWPGVASQRTHHLRLISTVNKVGQNSSKWVDVIVGGHQLHLFTDTGSDFTIIPPELYHRDMGKVVAADTKLRAWGSNNNLDVKGMVRTNIQTMKGATTGTKIYIVDGFRPEPLLGDNDAQSLGFITFHREGRDPLPNEIPLPENNKRFSASIPEKKGRA